VRGANLKATGRFNRSALRAPALSLASQVAGLLQLAVLLWRHGPSNATDAYFYLFNLGNLPTQILTVGVLYPMLLSADRITLSGAARFGRWVPLTALIAVVAGAGWLGVTGRVTADLLPVLLLSATNAVVQACLWFRAVGAEAGGTPQWVAAIALPANLLAIIVMMFPWESSTATVTAMMAALTTANLGLLVVQAKLRVGRDVFGGLPVVAPRRHHAHVWFLTKSGVSYGGLMVIQSLSLILPPSTLTLLTLPMKIVGSVAATFVNAVMPVLVHQTTESPQAARRFLRILAAMLGSAGAAGVVGAAFFFPQYLAHAAVVALWLIASASSSVAARMAFRFLPPSASRITIAVVPAVVIAVGLSAASGSFNLMVLLCAYAIVDAASSFLLLASLKDRLMAFLCGLVTLALSSIWVGSLL
jgi:hypothetical protein